MTVDLDRATSFMATHARMLDRRRFELLLGGGDPAAVLAAVDAYRNADGGYGWGLEPDLRAPESQPGGALHAFEAMAEVAPATTPRAVELCDWLAEVALPDGGLPFALPVADASGVAPFWASADPATSSLQITAYVTAKAHLVPGIEPHPWLDRATRYCLDAIASLEERPHALVLTASLWFAEAVHATRPEALEHLVPFLPRDGILHVAGGTEEEAMRPLDFAPSPGGPVRALLDEAAVAADLERLANGQREDGGWEVDFRSYSPAGALEWRGYATVRAVTLLRRHGLI